MKTEIKSIWTGETLFACDACILRERYWLYAVFDCGGAQPRLLRVQDPFAKLIARTRGSVAIAYRDIANASEAAE